MYVMVMQLGVLKRLLTVAVVEGVSLTLLPILGTLCLLLVTSPNLDMRVCV